MVSVHGLSIQSGSIVIHPDTELRFVNPDIGYGVFATRFIPKGSITQNFVDVAALLSTHPALARRSSP